MVKVMDPRFLYKPAHDEEPHLLLIYVQLWGCPKNIHPIYMCVCV